MYFNGAVALTLSLPPQKVKTIIESNRQKFEHNADVLDEVHKLIESNGPLEDAWASIAPESEVERIELEEQKKHLDEEDYTEIPELETPSKRQSKPGDFEISNSLFTSSQIQPLLRQLNEEQKEVFYSVRQWCLDHVHGQQPEPFRIFINGGAGTGKSHLIKCLYYEANKILSPETPNPDDIVVLLTAPTATAAFNIGGTTLHQAFSLSKSLPLPYHYKRDDELNKLRTKLQHLVILIIDEISMVGQNMLIYVSERLRQIKQSGNASFGNVCVIAVGDFFQLPPVKQKCLYDLRPENVLELWSSNFSLVQLNKIMRQKDDAQFAALLNRLRVKKKSETLLPQDRSILEACTQHTIPSDALHIFATNKEVNTHNSNMITEICSNIETISAQDFDKHPQSGKLIRKDSPYDTTRDFLPAHLLIAPKARVMLIRNIDISIGLVNGAIGTVTSILPSSTNSTLPKSIQVLFDNEKIGKNKSNQGKQSVSIEPFEENLNNNAIRHQFPLQLAWACTTHKVQGMTIDKAVVSLKHTFAAGMAYVALSRVRSMDGLVIKDFDEDKIYCIEQISDALKRMPQFVPLPHHTCTEQDHIQILLHNIQGLIPHFDDLLANSDKNKAHFICLTETWLDNSTHTPQINNFSLIHRPRNSCYSTELPLFRELKDKKHGGVAIYARNDQQYHQLSFHCCNLEYVAVNIPEIQTNLVTVYKPESYPTSIFMKELHCLLQMIQKEHMATILLGDFNEDILKPNTQIKTFLEGRGYVQIIDKPTTDGYTLIDHVYVNGHIQTSAKVLQTYYSYHNMISVQAKMYPFT
ncbi:ATP-dependent DNA helicase PIF1-like [Saccostrea cucullata]|uniref:ATP-dependent DNA helicase PIF1-like n=1 Tax=Saccostrea cuccullata TaxID=36930 RepID=UPI002ED5A7BC